MKVDIAYIVSHGFAARMVMQTNLLGKIAAKGKKVALISPDKSDENLVEYCLKNDILLEEFSSKQFRKTTQYFKSRAYFLEDINSNPALYEKYIREVKYSKTTSLKSRVKIRALKLIHDLKSYFPVFRKWYINKEKRIISSDITRAFLKKLDPAIIVSTYPVNLLEGSLLHIGNELNIKTIIHLLSWDNITCKGHFPALSDEYISWGPIMTEELISYYRVDTSKIHSLGVPHFDLHQSSRDNEDYKKHISELNLDPDLPYIVFGMSSPRFAPFEIEIVEYLAKQITAKTTYSTLQLIVRPHPQNVSGNMADLTWIERLKKLTSKNVAVDFPQLTSSKMVWSMQHSDMIRLSNILAGARICLNSGSTLSIDSLMCNTPVILTSFDGSQQLEYWNSARRLIDYTHLKKLVSSDGISVVKSYKELEEEILTFLNEPDYKKDARIHTVNQQCSNYKELATPRIVDFFTTN